MGILSTGTLESEVEASLGLKTPIDALTADGLQIDLLVKGIEATVKRDVKRNFEQKSYTPIHDVRPGQRVLFLEDKPVTWTKLDQITDWNIDGTVKTVEVVDRDSYYVDGDAFLVQLLGGSFSSGVAKYRSTYTAGYTSSQITTNADDEIKFMKTLLLSVLHREWTLTKDHLRHVISMGFEGQSAGGILVNYTGNELRMIWHLMRHARS